MEALRILIPEGSSLSAREAVAALGRSGYTIDVLDPDQLCLCRFSRFVRRVYRSPRLSDGPGKFADFLLDHLSSHSYDLVLPVHEHAFLLSAIAGEIRKHCPIAVAPFEAFERLQSKVRFFDLLEKLHLPYPPTQAVASPAKFPHDKPMPYYVKTAFGTAGDGTWHVSTDAEQDAVLDALRARESAGNLGTFLVQDVVPGTLEVVQSIFRKGDLIASHSYRQQIEGVGGSASGRISVHRPAVVDALQRLGESVAWHGALMLDYIVDDITGDFWFIDPNPRIGETMNAVLCGNNLPKTLVDITLSKPVPPVESRTGVRSHITLTALLAAAIGTPKRLAILREILSAWLRIGKYKGSREEIISFWHDAPGILPNMFVALRILLRPSSAGEIASRAVRNYAQSEHAVSSVRARWHSRHGKEPYNVPTDE